MKGSRLISTICQGEWLLDPHNVEAYFPLMQKVLSGESIADIAEAEEQAIISYVDSNGNKVKSVNGEVKVPKGSIAIVRMHGEVVKNGDWCVYGADEIVAALTAADKDKNVIATILDVDGPGGAVSAIGLFLEFRDNVKTKPIVALCDNALSLHYWTAIAVADHVMAANNVSARFGSVGVVFSFVDSRPVLEEKGYKFHEIYPKESDKKNKSFQLAREGDYKAIKEEFLSPLAKKFQAAVRKFRGEKLKESLDEDMLKGKVYFTEKALELGMIDSIGGMESAIRQATILSSINY